MDRYLIKKPRTKSEETVPQKKEKKYVQSTIESLQGVVVVEDILRHKSILKVENQTTDNLISSLSALAKKIPSRDVLKSTKIGHTVNKLTTHQDKEVSSLATSIVGTWKKHFQDKQDKPMLEVKCDHKTEKLRKAGRKLLAGALSLHESHIIPETIEREAFHQHKRLISMTYRRTMRTLVFTLKNKEDVRTKVLNKELDIADFVKTYKKESKGPF